MVCKKSIIAKILVFILVFMMFFSFPIVSHASDELGSVVGYFEYNGQQIPYYFLSTVPSNGYQYKGTNVYLESSVPVYFLFLKAGSVPYIYAFNFENFDWNWYYDYGNSVFADYNTQLSIENDIPIYFGGYGLYEYSYLYPSSLLSSQKEVENCALAFQAYMRSDAFIPYQKPILVDWYNARSNPNFALENVRGSVQDDVFVATWGLPDLIPNAEQYPILVDFTITDLATNERGVYYYPLAPDIYGMPRQTYFDALDLTLSIDLTDIVGLPTDYRVDFVALTPYYEWVGEHSSVPYYYKGQTSSIYLNYTGHYDFTVQIAPDDPLIDVNDEQQTEKGILISIQNFFSGFFNNFGTMLKNLFIPTKEQMQSLFADMESFFSDKLGFLWFPFDLAITIVETFTYGDADSVITVPPISLNILGGIDLYDGGRFDMDAVGVFPYVRMVSSLVLACSVAGLAYNKWDEWIGGHDK